MPPSLPIPPLGPMPVAFPPVLPQYTPDEVQMTKEVKPKVVGRSTEDDDLYNDVFREKEKASSRKKSTASDVLNAAYAR